jgi:hypothetical protein
VLAPDYPGFGQSLPLEGTTTFDRIVSSLKTCLTDQSRHMLDAGPGFVGVWVLLSLLVSGSGLLRDHAGRQFRRLGSVRPAAFDHADGQAGGSAHGAGVVAEFDRERVLGDVD